MSNFKPHSPKQEQAILSERKILALLTGIQFGKTRVGAVRMKMMMHRYTDPSDAFIVAAPNYKIMAQSTLPAFLSLMSGYGTYNKVEAAFRMIGGGTCYMRTATEPDSIVGVTNVRHLWIDEAGKVSRYFWENAIARAAFRNCGIDLTSSPYVFNWLYKDIVRPIMRDRASRPDVAMIQAASWENPFFPPQAIDQARRTMDQRRFNALFGGEWTRMAGLVYDCFDEKENICEPMTLPAGTIYIGGIDWGYSEPFVFKLRGITTTGYHFDIHEHYKSGLTVMDIEAILLRIARVYNIATVYCGPDQPASIEHLNRAFGRERVATNFVAADNDVRTGIDRHYALIKDRRYKMFDGACPHTLDEMEGYHYPEPEEIGVDKNIKDAKPVQQNDHAMDADRYISIMTYNMKDRRQPFVPEDKTKRKDHWAELEQLYRRKRTAQSENWS